MRIFVDIGHPAHVHYFRNIIKKLENKGHVFLITARDKEVTHKLMEGYGLRFISRGKGKNSLLGKLLYTLQADHQLLILAKKFKPDLFLSFASPYAAHVSKLMGKKHIAFDDTENAKLAHLLYRPFTDAIYSPKSYLGELHSRQKLFNGFMELTYLHPNIFSPNKEVLKDIGVDEYEPYVILRFVSWKANHDIGHKGITSDHKIRIARELSRYSKVFITSEGELPKELEKFRIRIPPEKMHDVLAFAQLLYGESATMASECAMLGVPSIYHDNVGRGYTRELETRYKIVYNFDESEEGQKAGLEKAVQIVQQREMNKFKERRKELLDNSIDVNSMIESIIENHHKM